VSESKNEKPCWIELCLEILVHILLRQMTVSYAQPVPPKLWRELEALHSPATEIITHRISPTILSTSQEIGWEERPRSDYFVISGALNFIWINPAHKLIPAGRNAALATMPFY